MKRIGLLVAIAVLGAASVAHACPFCKDSAPDTTAGASHQPVTAGSPYNLSIFVMLGGLFAVMGFVGRNVVRAIKSVDAMNAAVITNTSTYGVKAATISPSRTGRSTGGPADIRID
jgi:hypothetical protein